MNSLLFRAVIAFLVMPGVVAFAVPLFLFRPDDQVQTFNVVYTLLIATAFHLRVVLGEEPWLARTHGEEWLRYTAQVSRRFGRSGQRDSAASSPRTLRPPRE